MHAASPEASHPLVGRTLGGSYRILEVLDQGGMGTLFLAEHVRLHRRLAVKVMAAHLAHAPHALARFQREAEIISELHHPNVVQVVDFDSTESGEPYLVMEFLDGETLAARLEREPRLHARAVARIVFQAALGLGAAHRAGIVHRDLKPANIFLVTVPGAEPFVKLLDFGISKRIEPARRLTGEFDILGTADYMAPEQALGDTLKVDHRSDQYALGVIAYEALSGQTPFPGTDVADVLRRLTSAEPVPLERIAPDVPPPVGICVRRALQRERDERFPTVMDFALALLAATGCSLPPAENGARKPVLSSGAPRPNGRYQSAPNSSPPPASPVPPEPSRAAEPTLDLSDLPSAIEAAQKAFELGQLASAAHHVERALKLADALGPAAQPLISAVSDVFERILEARVGVRSQLVVRRVPSEPANLSILPEQAFLLSRLEGQSSLEEVLDLSPLPRYRTLGHLLGLLEDGVIVVE